MTGHGFSMNGTVLHHPKRPHYSTTCTLQIHRNTWWRLLKHASLKLFTAREKVITYLFSQNTFVYDSVGVHLLSVQYWTRGVDRYFFGKASVFKFESRQNYVENVYIQSWCVFTYNTQETGRELLFSG